MFRFYTTLFWIFCFPALGTLHAQLQPAQVAIVAHKGNAESRAVARYYAQKRGIPETQICYVDKMTDGVKNEVMERQEWDTTVRPAIRK